MNISLAGGALRPARYFSAICLVLSVTVLGGCGDEKSRAESEFIRGCKSGGGTTALCGCVYDILQTKYTRGGAGENEPAVRLCSSTFHGQHAECRSAVQKIRTSEHGACH